MSDSKFIKNNQTFTCINCGNIVPHHLTSSRDHCNKCLFGLHVDINPGDRANMCKGLLEPIGLEVKNGKERIVYKCLKCNEKILNIVAEDDDRNSLLFLSGNIWH